MSRVRTIGVAGLALGCIWAGGCVIEPYPHYHRRVYVEPAPVIVAPAPEPAPGVVDAAPPPPQVEVIPVAPGPDFVWTPGYWYWEGGRYVWRGGGYARRPHEGAVWVAPSWERGRDGRWEHHPGYWR
jgi:hypothetical protein